MHSVLRNGDAANAFACVRLSAAVKMLAVRIAVTFTQSHFFPQPF
jgi:hypothetical protein